MHLMTLNFGEFAFELKFVTAKSVWYETFFLTMNNYCWNWWPWVAKKLNKIGLNMQKLRVH